MRRTAILLATALLTAGAIAARADTLTLRDGSVREGKIVGESEDAYEFEIARGTLRAVVSIPKSEVTEVKRGASENERLLAEYARKRAALKEGDAEGWAELGLWCRKRVGLAVEADEAFRRAIAANPDHEAARRELGYVKVGDAWLTQDEVMLARGYVRHAGRWVTPEERSRIETEALAARERTVEDLDREARIRRELAEREARVRAESVERSGGIILPPTPYPYYDSLLYRQYGAYPYVSGTYIGPGVWMGTTGTCWPTTYAVRRQDALSGGVGYGIRWTGQRGHTSWDVGWGTNFGGGGGVFGGVTITHGD
jgi:hypothetical protein